MIPYSVVHAKNRSLYSWCRQRSIHPVHKCFLIISSDTSRGDTDLRLRKCSLSKAQQSINRDKRRIILVWRVHNCAAHEDVRRTAGNGMFFPSHSIPMPFCHIHPLNPKFPRPIFYIKFRTFPSSFPVFFFFLQFPGFSLKQRQQNCKKTEKNTKSPRGLYIRKYSCIGVFLLCHKHSDRNFKLISCFICWLTRANTKTL